jgi:multicomponent Na+:H+ antiporter subunit G
VTDVVVGVLAIGGAAFVLLAGIGVVRLPDLYARMHAATKATTLGILLVGAAGVVAIDDGRAPLALAVAVIFVTAPVASHVVGRAAYRAEGIEVRLEAGDDLASLVADADDVDEDVG